MPSIIFIDYIVTTLLYQSNVRNHLYSLYKENHFTATFRKLTIRKRSRHTKVQNKPVLFNINDITSVRLACKKILTKEWQKTTLKYRAYLYGYLDRENRRKKVIKISQNL